MMEEQRILIVMYHYVRAIAGSNLPAIKGLEFSAFVEQVEYLARHYNFIEPSHILSGNLPPRPVLLTFDDGYSDHYLNVFPVLAERGIKAVFAPVARTGVRVLDINKLHYVLASAPDMQALVEYVDAFVRDRDALSGISCPEYRKTMTKRRLDTLEVSYLKDLLQKMLPRALREELLSELFARYVTRDEAAFAAELYMSPAQLREMREAGMWLSIHGSTHRWLSTLSPAEQETEISDSIHFLERLGCPRREISVTYPYGDYNAETLRILAEQGIRLGFTVERRLADIRADQLLLLPRFDTNDVPKNSTVSFRNPGETGSHPAAGILGHERKHP